MGNLASGWATAATEYSHASGSYWSSDVAGSSSLFFGLAVGSTGVADVMVTSSLRSRS